MSNSLRPSWRPIGGRSALLALGLLLVGAPAIAAPARPAQAKSDAVLSCTMRK